MQNTFTLWVGTSQHATREEAQTEINRYINEANNMHQDNWVMEYKISSNKPTPPAISLIELNLYAMN